jgi:hypothetical protein
MLVATQYSRYDQPRPRQRPMTAATPVSANSTLFSLTSLDILQEELQELVKKAKQAHLKLVGSPYGSSTSACNTILSIVLLKIPISNQFLKVGLSMSMKLVLAQYILI